MNSITTLDFCVLVTVYQWDVPSHCGGFMFMRMGWFFKTNFSIIIPQNDILLYFSPQFHLLYLHMRGDTIITGLSSDKEIKQSWNTCFRKPSKITKDAKGITYTYTGYLMDNCHKETSTKGLTTLAAASYWNIFLFNIFNFNIFNCLLASLLIKENNIICILF